MIPASAFLYSTNAQVRAMENNMEATARDVAAEKESLRVLRAEWAYLNNPQRLSAATKHFLVGSQVVAANQVLPMNRVLTKIATREEAAKIAEAKNGTLTIASSAKAPAMLAKPISFDTGLLSTFHKEEKAKLPAAATWSQKMVSAVGTTSSLQPKGRSTP